MDTKYIESILTLCEEKNITKAAEKLFITQQGLSRRIKAIEKELGVKLFERSQNGVEPTQALIRIKPYFKSIYINSLMAQDAARNTIIRKMGTVTIAFAAGISNAINTDFIMDFAKKHPAFEIKLQEWTKSECIKRLQNREADILFMVEPFDRSAFKVHTIGTDNIYLVINKEHPLANHSEPIPLKLLENEKIITGSEQNALRGLFDYFCEIEGVVPQVAVSLSYGLDLINSMKDNMGIATVTSAMAKRIDNPKLVKKKLKTPKPANLYCVTLKDFEDEGASSDVLNYIIEYFKGN